MVDSFDGSKKSDKTSGALPSRSAHGMRRVRHLSLMIYHSLTRRILQLSTLAAVGVFINEHASSFEPAPDSSLLGTAHENAGQTVTSHGAQVTRLPSRQPESALPENERVGLNRLAASIHDIQSGLRSHFHSVN
ncbi:MAG: hypothetical protein RLZZ245_1984 [Verrucomicrobiota bacterium]